MNKQRILPVLLVSLLSATTWAQVPVKPLNLKLPPSDLPATSSSARTPATTRRDAPGTYYGDTSGHAGYADVANDDRLDCDDSTYNTPRVHGSVGMGAFAGGHVNGNYQTGTVHLSKSFGSCDDHQGGVSISVGAGTGRVHGRGH